MEPDIADEELDNNTEGNEIHTGNIKSKKLKVGTWKGFGFDNNLLKGITKQGFKQPTPIQRLTIPLILQGHDCVAMARTGSGKTAAFLIPMVQRLREHSPRVGVRGVILSPTRELAMQTLKTLKQLAKYTNLRTCLLVGGDALEDQWGDLATNPDILICTPGRLVHHILEVGLNLRTVEYIVFDEADRLFEMGLMDQIQQIISKLPETKQSLLFSATLPEQLVEFAKLGLNNPQLVRLDAELKLPETLKIGFFTLRVEDKPAALLHFIRNVIPSEQQTIIFTSTRHHVEYLNELLTYAGFSTSVVYGTMDHTARKINITKFRNQQTQYLIVTDVAARGIDLPLLDNVINYDFPPTSKLFVHRAGRVARMGRTGFAYSFVSHDELPFMLELYLFLARKPIDTVPNGVEYSDSDVYYGKIPQEPIDTEQDLLKSLHKQHIELDILYKTTQNAYKLYFKTRNKPSSESVKRAKELRTINIHPLLLEKISDQEVEKNSIMEGLKKFRPTQTIFEVESAAAHKFDSSFMNLKRKVHGVAIEKQKIKKVRTQELNTIQNESNEEDVMDSEDKPSLNNDSIYDDSTTVEEKDESEEGNSKKKKKNAAYKDEQYYMSSIRQNHHFEKAMSINQNSLHDKDLAFSVTTDEGSDLKKQHLVQKWDRKKKKFVQVDAKVDVNNRNKVRNEAGKWVKPAERGKMYQEWKKKHRMEIPKEGESESNSLVNKFKQLDQRWKMKNTNKKGTVSAARAPKAELKSRDQIRKERKYKEKEKKRLALKRSSREKNKRRNN